MIATIEPEEQIIEPGRNEGEASRVQAPPAGKRARRYNIPGDTVHTATADLDDEPRNAIRWLHHFGSEQNLNYAELGAMLKKPDGSTYDGNTVYKVLTGRHEAKLDGITKAVLDLKHLVEERASITRIPFVETNLTRRIWKFCEASLIYQKIMFIIGESQIGKTEALLAYQRAHNHGQTVYLRLPEGGGLRDTQYRLAEILKISTQASNLRDRIIAAFDDRMLLLVDEAHQCFLTARGQNRIRAFEYLREIHDLKRCGIVFCGTNVLDHELLNGPHRKLLAQFTRRGLRSLKLPDRPTPADLALIAKHYNLAPAAGEAADLQKEVIRDHGLGSWFSLLQAASRIASKTKSKLSWAHVLKADAALNSLANPQS